MTHRQENGPKPKGIPAALARTGSQSSTVCPLASIGWLDSLEKEFDKAFVDLDLILGEIDTDQSHCTVDGRQKITKLSGAFAQLVHKVQSVSHSNTRLEVRAAESGHQDVGLKSRPSAPPIPLALRTRNGHYQAFSHPS